MSTDPELAHHSIFLNKPTKDFLKYVVEVCLEHSISIHLYPSLYILDPKSGAKFDGWFDEEKPEQISLHVSLYSQDSSNALATLVHEFNHVCQFIQVPKDLYPHGTKEAGERYERWEQWINHETELSETEADQLTREAARFEWDCEERSIQMIKVMDLPINIQEYTKSANSYVFSYTLLRKYRKWYSTPPSKIPELCNMVPTTLVDFGVPPPEGWIELASKLCYEEEDEKESDRNSDSQHSSWFSYRCWPYD